MTKTGFAQKDSSESKTTSWNYPNNPGVLKKYNETHILDIDNIIRFIAEDSSVFKDPSYNDKHWPWMYDDKTDTIYDHDGIIWLRGELKDTGYVKGKPLALSIATAGALEVYINGKLIKSIGKIGRTQSSFKPSNVVRDEIVPILMDSTSNLLAIRWKPYIASKLIHLNENEGLDVKFGPTEQLIKDMEADSNSIRIPLFFCGVFIVLSVFHFILFFYYRKNRTNLYYALFTLLLFITFFGVYKIVSGTDNFGLKIISLAIFTTSFMVPLFFMGILHEVFYKKLLKSFWVFGIIMIISQFTLIIMQWGISVVILILYLFGCFGEIIRVFIKAYENKKDGAKIFIFGVVFPIIGIILMAITAWILETYGYKSLADSIRDKEGPFFGYAILMSMSISMTIYLARDFARMNYKLYAQITEIKSLLDKTIIQENEKKRILENQKAELERMVKVRTEEVEQQKSELEQINRDILDNLMYAKRIQDAILPDKKLILESLEESFIIYYPKDIVSGDFYTFARQHGKTIIAAADCTGHGVTGAFMSMIGSSLLNQIINEKRVLRPDLILNQLNEGIIESLRQNNSEINDGMDIAMCVIDKENQQLSYAGANRPLWIIRNNQCIDIKPNKFPIGGLQIKQDAVFTAHDLKLEKNDSIYLFTDGFADQFGGPDGKKLLSKRLREKLLSIQHLSMKKQEEVLSEFFKEWKGKYAQVDDVLVIGFRL